ncbi:MAG TPA: hypothetical protein PK020_04025 [Ilumatobacteraceae bacterium]|nr:hypothetical protein [Ilumatobacteraceae bacterium]
MHCWIDWKRALGHAGNADLRPVPVIVVTLTIVGAETAGRYDGVGPAVSRFVDMTGTWGYQPTEAEQAQRLTAANGQPAA